MDPVPVHVQDFDEKSGCWQLRRTDNHEIVTIYIANYGGYSGQDSTDIPSRMLVGVYEDVIRERAAAQQAAEELRLWRKARVRENMQNAEVFAQRVRGLLPEVPDDSVIVSNQGASLIVLVPGYTDQGIGL